MNPLVTVQWLKEHLSNENLLILDSSLNFENEVLFPRIKGAIKMGLKNNFINQKSTFPNTIPSSKKFEIEARKLGVCTNTHIIVYDSIGNYSSPRAWWLFKIMGHNNVSVLDGGLPEWKKHNFPIENSNGEIKQIGNFIANYQSNYLIDYKEVCKNTIEKKFTLIDARSTERFNGTGKEPRKHIKSGNIPHSINIPFERVLENGKFKSKKELHKIFNSCLNQEEKFVFSCGSGITACITLLASQIAGYSNLYVYDGSWTEWAENQQLFTNS